MKITRITGIPIRVTMKSARLRTFSVAQKISWASNRQTTRPEDLSYCLLGILGVNMPLLYGEGTRAFTRLQEAVMKEGADPTIFAWPSSALPPHTAAEAWGGPLAPSPAAFRDAGKYKALDEEFLAGYGPWSVTNRGIRIEGLPMIKGSKAGALLREKNFVDEDKIYEVALIGCFCPSKDGHGTQLFGIALYKKGNIRYRLRTPESLILLDSGIKWSARVDCIMQLEPVVIWLDRTRRLQSPPETTWIIRELPEERYGFMISAICDGFFKDADFTPVFSLKDLGYNASRPSRHQAIIFLNNDTTERFFVVVRVDDPQPWITIKLNTTVEKLSDFLLSIDEPGVSGSANHPYVDQTSAFLQDGKQVLVSVVRGVRDGKRVSFVDTCIRERR
jgi:hypothetical protein